MKKPFEQRFKERYEVAASGCWLWVRAISSEGYGVIYRHPKVALAHRVSYEMHKGAIPDGLQIDHLCRVRHCVNPDHRSAEHTSELPVTNAHLVCRLLLEKK